MNKILSIILVILGAGIVGAIIFGIGFSRGYEVRRIEQMEIILKDTTIPHFYHHYRKPYSHTSDTCITHRRYRHK